MSRLSKDDTLLPVEMGRLEIEPLRVTVNDENPFVSSQWRSSFFTRTLMKNSKCGCGSQRKPDITIPIYKKKNCKLVREPTLKLLQNHTTTVIKETTKIKEKPLGRTSLLCSSSPNENVLCTLVNDCYQLKISPESNKKSIQCDLNESKWWMNKHKEQPSTSKENDKNHASPSCSQQALNPPCDVTIDELASYFETLVHIPKKMSEMAEMMYI